MKSTSIVVDGGPAEAPPAEPRPHGGAAVADPAPAGTIPGLRLGRYVELTKPGITRLVAMTSAAGFYMGSQGGVRWTTLFNILVGVVLAAGGANALNEYVERELDGRMRRTRRRPLPSGRLSGGAALAFALAISILGTAYTAVTVNAAAALIVFASIVSYVLVYTPLKTRTTVNTLVGAIPGALPVLAGWAATGRPLEPAAWSLFGVLFLWQIPHFLALAWMHREDYAGAGYVMLSRDDPDGRATSLQSLLYALTLVPVSLLPTAFGVTGRIYFVGALLLGAGFVAAAAAMTLDCTRTRARRLFLASIVYLPLLLALMVLDKV